MAKTLVIKEMNDEVEIIIDGKEICDVLGYELKNNFDTEQLHPAELTLRVAIYEINAKEEV